MSHDIVADALNEIKNASRARKEKITIKISSKLLIEILGIMETKGYVKSYKYNPENNSVEIHIGNVKECKAIKPRYYVTKDEIEKYIRRYLPARDYGVIVISTNKGLMTHEEVLEKKIGGSLVAFFY